MFETYSSQILRSDIKTVSWKINCIWLAHDEWNYFGHPHLQTSLSFSIYFQEAADPLTGLPGYARRARGAGKGATIQAQRVQAHLGQSAVLGYKLSEKFMEEMGGGNFMQICSFKRGKDGKQVASTQSSYKLEVCKENQSQVKFWPAELQVCLIFLILSKISCFALLKTGLINDRFLTYIVHWWWCSDDDALT